jgi:hypothetical protein
LLAERDEEGGDRGGVAIYVQDQEVVLVSEMAAGRC